MRTMKYVEVKGARVPALGFGTYGLNGGSGIKAIRLALDVGFRHLDTASRYENEAEVGRAIAESGVDRGEVFLTTKVWPDSLAYGDLQRSAERSLGRLKTDYVDLLLIHWPSTTVPLAESLRALAEVKRAGKARHIGVSNFSVERMEEAEALHGGELLCNQVEYNPTISRKSELEFVRAHGMMLTAYTPIARGATNGDATLSAIGRKYGKSGVQVALRWLIEQQGVAAIPKAASEKHCRENLAIFDFALTPAERAAIDGLAGPGK